MNDLISKLPIRRLLQSSKGQFGVLLIAVVYYVWTQGDITGAQLAEVCVWLGMGYQAFTTLEDVVKAWKGQPAPPAATLESVAELPEVDLIRSLIDDQPAG